MKKPVVIIVLLIVLVLLGAAAYFQWQQQMQVTEEIPLVVETPVEQGKSEEPRYPIPVPSVVDEAPDVLSQESPDVDAESAQPEPLPALNESNPVVMQSVVDLLGEALISELFKQDELVRRFVVTVDNLPNKKLSRRQALIKPVAGTFQVAGEEDAWVIDTDNAQRYAPYIKLITELDTEKAVALYVRFYPLFQEAYVELGYPDGYFNDRLVDVIDHLLQTPAVDEPIRLARPHVFYQYADPQLEALSAGQKSLLRMGRANADRIKAWLAEVRPLLVTQAATD